MNKGNTYVKNSPVLINASSILYEGGGKTLDKLFDLVYPVGSIYLSVNSTNPKNLFGGTWVQITDRFLLAAGSTYAGGATGGSATHYHLYRIGWYAYYSALSNTDRQGLGLYDYPNKVWKYGETDTGMAASSNVNSALAQNVTTLTTTARISAAANTQATSSLPPYIAVYVWKRTA